MTNSILLTVKKMLGIAEEYKAFDLDIIININSVFLTLNQLGVGPIVPFQITDEEQTWEDFQPENLIPGVQTYVYLKTRLLFDPPTNSFLVETLRKQAEELEWRMNVQVETPPSSLIDQMPEEPEIPEEPIIPPDESEDDEIDTYSITPITFQQKIMATMNANRHERRIRHD